MSATSCQRGHNAYATSASNRVSISIVPETEMPYAVARFVELPKLTTSRITTAAMAQFTPGM
jgi:hypothetical protein